MGFEFVGAIGVAAQIVAVGKAFGKQDMHHRASECAVRAGAYCQMQVSLLGGTGAVGVNDDEFGAAFFGGHRVLHDIDLGINRIAAPNDDQIGMLGGLAQVDTALATNTGDPAAVGEFNANRGMPARIAHCMTQSLYAIPLHQTHGASIKIRPDCFRSKLRGLL